MALTWKLMHLLNLLTVNFTETEKQNFNVKMINANKLQQTNKRSAYILYGMCISIVLCNHN